MSVYAAFSICLCVIGKERDFICDAFPSESQVRYVYQKHLICEMFICERGVYALSEKGKSICDHLIPLAMDYLKINRPHFQPVLSDLAMLYAILVGDYGNDILRDTGAMILSYAHKNKLKKEDPFPEEIFSVDQEIENDFLYKSSKEIFEEKIINTSFNLTYFDLKDDFYDISEHDQFVLDRVIRNGNPQDKSVLYVGFEQDDSMNGLGIYYDIPGYTRSIFWNLLNNKPNENYNAFKFCFCKINDFLDQNPQLHEYFDYIIVSNKMAEYFTADVWLYLGTMLKRGGRIVYPDTLTHYFSPFLNMILSECCESSRGFELYKCDNTSEVVYDEIRQLVSFYKPSNYETFPYATTKILYWHKKL